MKAITTKYAGATNTRGSRIIVKAEGGPSKSYAWDNALNIDENHIQAAKQYRDAWNWTGEMVRVSFRLLGRDCFHGSGFLSFAWCGCWFGCGFCYSLMRWMVRSPVG